MGKHKPDLYPPEVKWMLTLAKRLGTGAIVATVCLFAVLRAGGGFEWGMVAIVSGFFAGVTCHGFLDTGGD